MCLGLFKKILILEASVPDVSQNGLTDKSAFGNRVNLFFFVQYAERMSKKTVMIITEYV